MLLSYTYLRRALIGLLLILLQSCSHQQGELPAPASTADNSISISEAQIWYQDTYGLTFQINSHNEENGSSTVISNGKAGLSKTHLVWSRALTAQQAAQKLVLIPLANDQSLFAGRPWQGVRYLIVSKEVDGGIDSNIIELLMRRTNTPIDTVALFANLYYNYQAGSVIAPTKREGYVLFYSPDYHYLTGKHFRNGKVLAGNASLTFSPSNGSSQENHSSANLQRTNGSIDGPINGPIVNTCIDWYNAGTGEYITTTGDCGLTMPDLGESPTGTPGGGGGTPGDYAGGGGGGGTGSEYNFSRFNPADVYPFNGNKPLGEYASKCSGLQKLWDLSWDNNYKETVGVITTDGKLLSVAVVGSSGGGWGGLYYKPSISPKVYYTWPDSQGPPTQTYAGMVHAAGQYFIPISATVHTHTPCLTDGTDGVSGTILSQGDQNVASTYPNIAHYLVGCNAIGSFNGSSSSPALIKTGPLSETCPEL